MTNNNLPPHDVQFLNAVAEFLLRVGADRSADAIYAAIESASTDNPADNWAEVFAG